MSQEDRCPHCGQPFAVPPVEESFPSVVDGSEPGFPPPGVSDADHEVEPSPVAMPGSGSPVIGETVVNDGRSWRGDEELDLLRTPDPDQLLSRFAWAPSAVAGEEPTADETPTIELGRERVPDQVEAAARRWEASVQPEASHGSGGEVARSGTPIGFVLLASYASAMTLACGWLLLQARRPSTGDRESRPETIQASAPDPNGRRGGLSARVVPLAKLKADHITSLEKSMRVGDLEITPMTVKVESLRLERSNLTGQPESRVGLPGTLVLRLDLTNRSSDAVFAPLDEAFVRQTDAGPPLGYVEGADGARVYLYPLAETDEWGLVGQRFNTLRPGERVETLVATDEDAMRRLGEGPYLWRLRLRVGADPGAIEDLGVRLTREQIR